MPFVAFGGAQVRSDVVSPLCEKMAPGYRARVKQAEVLAVIVTPDLDQQLAPARADLETAQAKRFRGFNATVSSCGV